MKRKAKTPNLTDEARDRKQAEQFMRRAIDLGRRGMKAGDGGPFGAVVVKSSRIVGQGWNRVVASNDPTAHGEIVAIRDAGKRLKSFNLAGCDLYTSGQPCPMCLSAIYWARIERVFFGFSVQDAARIGFDDARIYRQLAKPRRRRRIPEIQLLAQEARQVVREYAANPKRVRY